MNAATELSQPPPLFRLPRAIVPIGITQLIAWGTTYYLPAVLKAQFMAELGLSEAFVFAGVAITLIVSALLAWPMGRFMDAVGAGRILPFGSLFLAAGLIVLGFSVNPMGYAVAWLLFGFGMAMAMSNAVFAALAQIAGQQARRGIVIVMLFGGMAATVFWPITLWLDALIGWRNVCFVYAAIHVVLCLPLHVVFVAKATERRLRQDLRQDEARGLVRPSQHRAASLLLLVALAGNGFVSWGLDLHLIALIESFGLTTAVAVGLAALKGPATLLSRLSDIVGAGRISPMASALAAGVLIPAGLMLALLFGSGMAAALLFVVIYSFGTGLMTVARATLPLSLLGAKGYAVIMGRLTLPTQIVYALSPVAFSLIIGKVGATGALLLCLLVSIGSLGALWALGRLARQSSL
jgi:hypothetical protein